MSAGRFRVTGVQEGQGRPLNLLIPLVTELPFQSLRHPDGSVHGAVPLQPVAPAGGHPRTTAQCGFIQHYRAETWSELHCIRG